MMHTNHLEPDHKITKMVAYESYAETARYLFLTLPNVKWRVAKNSLIKTVNRHYHQEKDMTQFISKWNIRKVNIIVLDEL